MEVVSMPQALRVHPIEIDDSRLNALWTRQNRKGLWLAAAAGALAVLVGAALVVMAFRLNAQPPVVNVAAPVVNIPEQKPPVVNITVPEQKPPVVNVTVPPPVPMPQAPAMPSRPGETGKVVTEHTIFHDVKVGANAVVTGWKFHSSNDTEPYNQFCYVRVSRSEELHLAEGGELLSTLDVDARKLGVDIGQAKTFAYHCRWFGQ